MYTACFTIWFWSYLQRHVFINHIIQIRDHGNITIVVVNDVLVKIGCESRLGRRSDSYTLGCLGPFLSPTSSSPSCWWIWIVHLSKSRVRISPFMGGPPRALGPDSSKNSSWVTGRPLRGLLSANVSSGWFDDSLNAFVVARRPCFGGPDLLVLIGDNSRLSSSSILVSWFSFQKCPGIRQSHPGTYFQHDSRLSSPLYNEFSVWFEIDHIFLHFDHRVMSFKKVLKVSMLIKL